MKARKINRVPLTALCFWAAVLLLCFLVKGQTHLHVPVPGVDGIHTRLIALNQGPRELRKEAQRHDRNGEEKLATQDYESCVTSPGFADLRPAIRSGYRELIDVRVHAQDKDYFHELVCRDHVGYWKADRMPIRVYIPGEEEGDGFSSVDKKLICDSLNDWMAEIPDKLSYKLVNNYKDGDVRFSQKRNCSDLSATEIALGHTVPLTDRPPKWSVVSINKVNVDIAREDSPIKDIDSAGAIERRRVFLHEIGHALGVSGHSCNAGDIMFFTTLDEEFSVPKLSQRDKATIRKIYEEESLESFAEKTIRTRATEGDKYALFRMADNLADETPTPKVKQEIFLLLKRAADAGLPDAQTMVGNLYLQGEGVTRDVKQAIHYLTLATKQDAGSAFLSLASIYEEGTGVSKDLSKAEAYYQQALPFGSRSAQVSYADFLCYQRGDQESFARAVEHYKIAANVLSTESMARLATIYANGYGVPTDKVKSQFWLNKALAIIHTTNPSDAAGYFMRGRLWKSIGHSRDAIADYNAALALDPKKTAIFFKRASAHFSIGDVESATRDLAEAIKYNPEEPASYFLRSLCYLAHHQPEKCITDVDNLCKRAVDPGSTYLYGLIYGTLAHKMMHNEIAAKQMIEEARKRTVQGSWPRPLVEFLDGSITASELENKSHGDDQDAESKAVIGFTQLASGDREKCIQQMQWIKDYGDERFYEHSLAVTLLARLNPDRSTKQSASQESEISDSPSQRVRQNHTMNSESVILRASGK